MNPEDLKKMIVIVVIFLAVVFLAKTILQERAASIANSEPGPVKVTPPSKDATPPSKVTSPTEAVPGSLRNTYYPGSEPLRYDEIRLTGCGTGMAGSRLAQASTCWLVELGNGQKYFFDVGMGSGRNFASYLIPWDFLDKVFLTHLHVDHWGDLEVLWVAGWTGGRTKGLTVWGPSGRTDLPEYQGTYTEPGYTVSYKDQGDPSKTDTKTYDSGQTSYVSTMGTKYAVENFLNSFNWDKRTRAYTLSQAPGKIKIHEFDYETNIHTGNSQSSEPSSLVKPVYCSQSHVIYDATTKIAKKGTLTSQGGYHLTYTKKTDSPTFKAPTTVPYGDGCPTKIYDKAPHNSTSGDNVKTTTVITSWPAIHTGDGPVSYLLTYKFGKGKDDVLHVIIGGDTYPNNWYLNNAQALKDNAGNSKPADVAIHEVFWTPFQLTDISNQSPSSALIVGTQVHTSPPAFGKVMASIKPRLAIGYHFWNEPDARYQIYEQISALYPQDCSDCQLTLALDNLVWNITKKNIRERVAAVPQYASSPHGPNPSPGTDYPPEQNYPYTKEITSQGWSQAAPAQKDLVCTFYKQESSSLGSTPLSYPTADEKVSEYCKDWTPTSK